MPKQKVGIVDVLDSQSKAPSVTKPNYKKNNKQEQRLFKYVDKEVYFSGVIVSETDVVSLDYVGKSLLITDLLINQHDKDMGMAETFNHLWIHENEFNRIPKGRFLAKGTVYAYSKDYRNGKILYTKCSIKNITIMDENIISNKKKKIIKNKMTRKKKV